MTVWTTSRGKKILAYVILLALLGHAIRLLAYALVTGETYSRFGGWYSYSGPLSFLFSILGILAFAAFIIFALYVLCFHERFFASKLSQIWQTYKELHRPRR